MNEPHRFDKLREDAWDRFLEKSEPLAAASRANLTALERECGWQIALWVRLFRWIAALVRSFTGGRRSALAPPQKRTAAATHRGASTAAGPAVATVEAAATTAEAGAPQGVTSARVRPVVSPDRHAYLAERSSRFARALRGAQRARAEASPTPDPSSAPDAAPVASPSYEADLRGRPVETRPDREGAQMPPASPFMAEWERHFDTNRLSGLSGLTGFTERGGLTGLTGFGDLADRTGLSGLSRLSGLSSLAGRTGRAARVGSTSAGANHLAGGAAWA